MTDDAELLRRYALQKSEVAFAELVRRHVDMVYTVARRRLGGDAHLAEDVTQGVFTDLACKAAPLSRHPAVGAWLFRSARFAAAQAMRAERRRGPREQEAYLMHELTQSSAPDPNWNELRPVIDDVMDELPERDRTAVWLRFYEGRPFAEIGARLAASEDAARVRVDRALERMRTSLARRSIVSTTAALSSALARETAAMAPAGLAATVTDAALAGAAAGGGVAAALGLSTIMSTTKLGAWGVAVAALIASVAGNAYLLLRKPPAPTAPSSTLAEPPISAKSGVAATPASLVKDANLALLRDQMRASGASEVSIRGVLEGILRRRYREQLSADRAARLRRGWWRDDQRTWGTASDIQAPFDDLRLIHKMVTQPLEQLLGPDPSDVAEADARYGFLPVELREAFGRLDRAAIGGWAHTGQPDVDAAIRAEMEQSRRTTDEKRKELMAALTPEQRTEYEMRFGAFASGLAQQLQPVSVSEQDFHAIFPLADGYAKELAQLSSAADPNAAKADLDRRMVQQLVAALGYDRALDYIWSGVSEYPAYARIAREASLPAATAGQAMQLAAETADRAVAVHDDPALSVEQKRAALVALQQTVRPQLDALIPAAAQERLPPGALAWVTQLSDGRYKMIWGPLPGQIRTTGAGGSVSVTAPPPAFRTRQLLPQRPPGS